METGTITWVEPWPGVQADGTPIDCHCTISMSAEDCIRYQRAVYLKKGVPLEQLQNDQELLAHFVSIHWAGSA